MLGDPIAWLETHGAQRDVLDGLRTCSRDWRSLWRDCPRGDWLLGIAVRIGVDHASLVRAATWEAAEPLIVAQTLPQG